MISNRSKLSLIQFLSLFDRDFFELSLKKYFSFEAHNPIEYLGTDIDILQRYILDATADEIKILLNEIILTEGDLRNRVSPHCRFKGRWDELVRCIYLDGYKIEDRQIIPLDPSIEGKEVIEDDLTKEIIKSDLVQKEDIIKVLNNSTEDFKKSSPDYNGCLNNARVALQNLATKIAISSRLNIDEQFDTKKWGEVLIHLRISGFINEIEEKGLSGVFSFISPGSHTPIGANKEEMARLGRTLAFSMCYFLIKRYNCYKSK